MMEGMVEDLKVGAKGAETVIANWPKLTDEKKLDFIRQFFETFEFFDEFCGMLETLNKPELLKKFKESVVSFTNYAPRIYVLAAELMNESWVAEPKVSDKHEDGTKPE